jgi:hypothetical protein
VQGRFHIHGVGDCLADPSVLERVASLDVGRAQLGAALIETEKHRHQLGPVRELQLWVAADLRKRPVGHALDQIEPTLEQGSDVLGVALGNVNDAVDVVWVL